MTSPISTRRPMNASQGRPSEEGYVLLAVIFLVALLTISLAIAMPKVAKEIQRDRELETMQRGKQYARAVRMYYKKFGAYPPNVDALVKPTNNIRFLRKKYADTTTGRKDWKPVLFGMNKAPTAMGFFGQPLGGIGGCVATNPLGTSSGSVTSPSSSFGNTPGSATGATPNCSGTGVGAATPTGTGSTSSTDPNSANTTTSAFGQTGQTFGGAGIIGFSPNSPKQSIMVYKTKNHYNEWEFVYDPQVDMMQMQGGSQGTVPVQPGAPGVGLPTTPTTPTQ